MAQASAPVIAGTRPQLARFERIGSSLREHPNVWMYGLLALGFFVRVWHASGTFLNSDEAQHFSIANQPSFLQTYLANSRVIAHPPLLVLFLHAWRHLGTSELMLRFPSILAGTAFCWFAFKWLSTLFEQSVAWTAFILVLFLPASIQLSSEIRQYPFLLAFSIASAYFLERAIALRSAILMFCSGLCLWLAICSHFSAFFFAAVLGVYAIWRLVRERVPLRLVVMWEFGQIIAMGLAYFFYVTQLATLQHAYGQSSAAGRGVFNAYLGKSYFTPGSINPLAFVLARTGSFFQFTFTQLIIGDIAALIFIVGVVAVYRNPSLIRINSHLLGLLLILPFAINMTAALLHAYPYGGGRQCAFLLPFATASLSAAIAWACKTETMRAISVAAVIVSLCHLFPSRQLLPDAPGGNRVENMRAAISLIQQLPRDEPLLVDPQSSELLTYYLCEQNAGSSNYSGPDFVSYECSGRKMIVARHEYVFTPQRFPQRWENLIKKYDLPPGAKVCVVQMGWATHLAAALTSQMSLTPHSFGSEIHIFELSVGQTLPAPSVLPPS